MIRRTLLLLLVAGSIGGLAAGCGSSSTPSSTPASTSAGAGGTGTSGGAGAPSNPAVAAAVTACKNKINATSQLSSSLKAKLTQLCDQAGSGNLSGAKKIAGEVCTQIIKSELPSITPTAIKDQALAACKKAAS